MREQTIKVMREQTIKVMREQTIKVMREQTIKVMTGEGKGLSLQQSFSEIQPSTVLLYLTYFKTSIDHTATTGIKFHY